MTSLDLPPDRFNPCYIPPDTVIGKYVVRTGIGRGGGQMAYLAHDPHGNLVVLKFSLFPRGETDTRERMMHERFIRQVQYFLQLSDAPGVASVYEHGMHPDNSEHGHPYLVQEYVWGGTNIVDWFRARPRALEFVARGWMYLASACGAMEQRGICHRDLKPENVLMLPQGVPKIIDFNSGMSVGAAPLTATGPGWWFPGTRAYFSPELCKAILAEWANPGRNMFTYLPTCDLHALGIIFYEVLTGEHPFDENTNDGELFQRIAYQVPRLPRTLNPEVPFSLEKVTMKLLRKDPEERYQTGDELAHDLEALLETPEDWNRPFQTPARKRRSTLRRQTSRTRSGNPPLTPRPRSSASSAALKLAPSAIVLAGPRALAVRGPRKLLRVVTAPSTLVSPPVTVESVEPTPRPLVPRRRALLLAAGLALALVVPWLALGQHERAGPFFERGVALLGKAKAAVVAAASTVLAACVGLKVRTGERDWLETCSPEARKNVTELELETSGGSATLLEGPNVIVPEAGVELKDGPVEARANISTPSRTVAGRLFGDIRTGSDGASIHFTKLKLFDGSEPEGQPPAGRELKICAIAYVPGYGAEPGIPKVEHPSEPVELHPGFTYVTTRALRIHFAH